MAAVFSAPGGEHTAAYSAPTDDVDNLPLVPDVEKALQQVGYLALRSVQVSAHGPAVVLRGQVPTYHLKQLAQATAKTVGAVRQIRNEVEVRRP